MTAQQLFVDGVAFWSPHLPDWALARAAFREEAQPLLNAQKRPTPSLLQAAEARRVPDTVAMALATATLAAQGSGHARDEMPSVFVSCYGDLSINDHLCRTLVQTPTLVSPTKFHNSVHNAAAGYWTIGTGCMQASTALSAYDRSFAAGLLEAAMQAVADATPVLLVAYDSSIDGTLGNVTRSQGALAVAMVLSPRRGPSSQQALTWRLQPGDDERAVCRSAAARALSGNAMGDALPFVEALAREKKEPFTLALSDSLSMHLRLEDC